MSQNSLKNYFGKVVFQVLAKIAVTQNKNRLFGHFETVRHLFFPTKLWFFIVHTFIVQISSKNSAGKVVFYGWVPRIPLWHQREWEYLGHLSVKNMNFFHLTRAWDCLVYHVIATLNLVTHGGLLHESLLINSWLIVSIKQVFYIATETSFKIE